MNFARTFLVVDHAVPRGMYEGVYACDECWEKLGQTNPAVQLALSVRHVNFNLPPPPPIPLEGDAGFIGPLPQAESERTRVLLQLLSRWQRSWR